MDLYLVSNCFFYIGSNGGLDVLPTLLRKPKLSTNLVPIIGVTSECKNVMTLFKHHFSSKLNRKISIREIVENDLDNSHHGNVYKEKDIKLLSNSPDEILNATKDLIKKIENKLILNSDELENQKKFWKIFPLNKKDSDGIPIHGEVRGLISPSFLEENQYFLN